MKNYDVCKEINQYYFSEDLLALSAPAFFDKHSEEARLIDNLNDLIKADRCDEAIELSEHYMAGMPEYTAQAFLAMQIFALWKQKKVPDEELINYFISLEDILPNDAAIDFNKATFLVRQGKFNEAMKGLEKARRKDAGHVPSANLQFWILYFSRDPQWQRLFPDLVESKVWPEHTINLIQIVESIRDNNEGDLYAFGTDNQQQIESLFLRFPDIVIDVEPTAKNILFVAADTKYLQEYCTALMSSAHELKDKNFGLHIHLYAPLGTDIEILENYAEAFPDLQLSYSHEKHSFTIKTGVTTYYASMRFPRACQILKKCEAVQRIAITDADAIIRKDPFKNPDISNNDTVLTGAYEIAPDWDQFAAGFSVFSKNKESVAALEYLSSIILKNFYLEKEFWFIDQIALFEMHRRYEKAHKIWHLKMDVIFGKDMKHSEDAYLWTYTNDEKQRDNPMNRERLRIFGKYNIAQPYNQLNRVKYGIMPVNKNDQFIARSLLAYGSWCEDEVQWMRYILDHGDTVLEVGANMGSHTLPLAKAVGEKGKVIAIEPQRLMYQNVCAVAAMNSLPNIYAYWAAAGSEMGHLDIAELDPRQMQNFGGYQPKANKGDLKVPLITLDSLELSSCKLIKMDIEGMEIEALRGAKETLKKFEPILFFESHGDKLIEIREFLNDFGYKIHNMKPLDDPDLMYLAATPKYAELVKDLGLEF